MTIQQSSESRAISTTALKPGHWACDVGTADPNPESVLKFYCYICKTNCCSQQVKMHRSDRDPGGQEMGIKMAGCQGDFLAKAHALRARNIRNYDKCADKINLS